MRDKNLVLRSTLIVLLAGILSACGGGKTSTATSEPSPVPTPVEITYCDISSANLCLISFGFESESSLLITFYTSDPKYATMTLTANNDPTLTYDCQPAEAFPDRIYCTGPVINTGDTVDLTFYDASGKLFARGAFVVGTQQALPPTATITPTVVVGTTPLPTSSPVIIPTATQTKVSTPRSTATPEDSYPSYP